MKKKLTKRTIDALKLPRLGSQMKVYDPDSTGFGLVVHPTGRKVFFVEWGDEGHRPRTNIGAYGPWTPKKARAEAREKLNLAAKGVDLNAEKQEARAALTFAEWAASYLTGVEQRKKSPRDDRRYLSLARKRFGPKRLRNLTTDDVERLFRSVAADHRTAGNRLLASVRACLQAAWRAGHVVSNVAMRVRANPEKHAAGEDTG